MIESLKCQLKMSERLTLSIKCYSKVLSLKLASSQLCHLIHFPLCTLRYLRENAALADGKF
jgi:hypothetical protein